MNFDFLDLKATFNSVDHAVLWCSLSVKDMPEKFIPLMQLLSANNRSQVDAYGDHLPQFTTCEVVFVKVVLFPISFITLSLWWFRDGLVLMREQWHWYLVRQEHVWFGIFGWYSDTEWSNWSKLRILLDLLNNSTFCTFEVKNAVAGSDCLEAGSCSCRRTTGWRGWILLFG